MDKAEKATAVKRLWKSLVVPKWTRDDLIDFGKAIFSKVELKDMPEKTLSKILPFLLSISEELNKDTESKNESARDPNKL